MRTMAALGTEAAAMLVAVEVGLQLHKTQHLVGCRSSEL